jgi:hypothetical protein
VWYIIVLAGLAPTRRSRVTSNYKGFPICQTSLVSGESRQRFTFVIRTLSSLRRANSLALISGKGCGLEELQPVIDAVTT